MPAFKPPHLLPDPSATIKGSSPRCSGTDGRVGRTHLDRLHLCVTCLANPSTIVNLSESMLTFRYRCRQHLLPSHLYDRCLDFVDDAGDGQWSVVSEYPVISFLVEYLQYSEAL